jgi:hypothetical protein
LAKPGVGPINESIISFLLFSGFAIRQGHNPEQIP